MVQKKQVYKMVLDKSSAEGEVSANLENKKSKKTDWKDHPQEGELSVDVFETEDSIVVVSPIAGANMDQIELYVRNDLLTIKGYRNLPVDREKKVLCHLKENFWGPFSRTIILPVDVHGHNAKAEYKKGVLKVTLPKQDTDSRIPVVIVEE